MPHRHAAHRHRPFSVVGDDQLPDVRIDGNGTVPMSDEQYTAAVHALAVLIDNWRASQTSATAPVTDDGERPLAA